MRYHFWVLIRPEGRYIQNCTFVEPSTGISHSIDSPNYTGIESVWNHQNYWVLMYYQLKLQDVAPLATYFLIIVNYFCIVMQLLTFELCRANYEDC